MGQTSLDQKITEIGQVISNSLTDARHMTAGRIWAGILTGVRAFYMGVNGANTTINQAVLEWSGVTKHVHRYGGTEWRLGRREIGHIHGNYLVDIPFPKKVRDEVVAAGEAEPHHILPKTGWISFYLREPEDVEQAVSLLRRSYELAVGQQARRQSKNK